MKRNRISMLCSAVCVTAFWGLDLVSPLYASEEVLTATLKDAQIIAERLHCSDYFQGGAVSKLVIEGIVEIKHPSESSFYYPPEHDVIILCDFVHFNEGSVLRSPSNLRLIVDKELSGTIHIESSRGIRGLDAPPKSDQYVGNPAANGTDGQPGKDGANGSDLGGDGTAGQHGADANHGNDAADGFPGDGGGRGADGSRIWLTVKSLSEDTTVLLKSTGGEGGAGGRGAGGQDGGKGGRGGYGGQGGDSSLLHDAERGGNGGRGGDGGDGGNGGPGGPGGPGGNGGDLAFYIVGGGNAPSEALYWSNGGGLGGWPGIGGPGGTGGEHGEGGAAGCGGSGKGFNPLPITTIGLWTVVIDDEVEIKVHGSGECGSWGAPGIDGNDGAPGPLGSWGSEGKEGQKAKLFQGFVTIQDYETYKEEHSGS